MAKKQSPKAVSPEKFMRSKARNLPLYKCYINPNWEEEGMAQIIVSRRHTHGTVTFANILVDTWCRGVVDTFYKVNVPEDEMNELYDYLVERMPIEETDYALVHNIIYGAIEWAEDAGISPHRSFDVAQYILDDDDDNAPFIDLEFGRNGRYCLCVPDPADERKYIKILEKNIGPGNFDYISRIDEVDVDEDFDFSRDLKVGMYKYPGQHPDPSDLTKINYPWLVEKLGRPVNKFKSTDIDEILALPAPKLKADLENIIMSTIGMAWQDIESQEGLYDTLDYNILANALRLLGEVGDEDSAEAIFEFLRQTQNFIEFFLGDYSNEFLSPTLYKLLAKRPEKIVKFIKQPGLEPISRNIVLDAFFNECMMVDPDAHREVLYHMSEEILKFYLDNNDDQLIWDSSMVGLTVSTTMDLNDQRLLPLYRQLYATGDVDEDICGSIEDIEAYIMNAKADHGYPLDIYQWVEQLGPKLSGDD